MKSLKLLCWTLAALLSCGSLLTAEMVTRRWGSPKARQPGRARAARARPPTGYVVDAKDPPVIDGKLDEKAWTGAFVMSLLRTLDGANRAAQPTEVRALRDAKMLYLGLRCREPFLSKLKAVRRSHDGAIWSDDSVEIFLSPAGSGTYYHIGINAVGSTYDGRGKDSSWNSGLKAAASKGRGHWAVEAAIPLKRLCPDGNVPERWSANFNRARYARGQLEESAWSPTYSGDSHVPERFGRLLFKAPPAQRQPADEPLTKAQSLVVLPCKGGAGVARFDLSELPKGAKIHRAELLVGRTAAPTGRDEEALVDIEIHALLTAFAAGEEPQARGKPLPLRGPWYDCFDATEAVRAWASGKPNGGFFFKACPFWDVESTHLDVAYEGKPENLPPQAKGLSVFHRSGQTFITFREIEDLVGADEVRWGQLNSILASMDSDRQVRYVVYRHDAPITAGTLHQARPIATVRPLSCWNVNGRSIEKAIDEKLARQYALIHGHWNPFCRATIDGEFGRDCLIERLVVGESGQPLPRGTGLYVHTATEKAQVYYAVVTSIGGVQNTTELSKENSLSQPVAEIPAEPEPVLQKVFAPKPYWNYAEKRHHYVRWVAPPYVNVPYQYYNWAVSVPLKLKEPAGLELSLHRDDRSYDRTQYRIERNSIVVAPHDFPLATWWFGYHESLGTLKSFRQGVVHNYTERRLLSFLNWVSGNWPVDRNRILVTSVHRRAGGAGPSGRGGGCSGALQLGMRYPKIFNLVLPGYGARPNYPAGPHPTMEQLWGKVEWNLKTNADRSVWEELNATKRIRELPAAAELPMVTLTGQKMDPATLEFIAAMLGTGRTIAANFDYWGGPKLLPVSATGTWPPPMVRLDVRKDFSMLAFGRGSVTGIKAAWKKRPHLHVNLGYRWRSDDIVDQPARYEVTLWRTGREAAQTDITLRRLQQYTVAAGKSHQWLVRDLESGKILQEGESARDEDGLLTLAGANVPAKPARLVVTPK